MKKQITSRHYRLELKEREDGSVFIPLEQNLLSELGWQDGDEIEWIGAGKGFRVVNLSVKERLKHERR